MSSVVSCGVLKIGIPFSAVGIISFVVVAGLAALFLWWWFKRRNAHTISITKIASGKEDLQKGRLYRDDDTIYTIDKNETKAFNIRDIKTAVVSEVENEQQGYYHFRLQFVMKTGITIAIEGNPLSQSFFNGVLIMLQKPAVDFVKPLPQMRKIGGMVIKGYKIAI